MNAWRPELPSDARPAYARIVGALAADIERGALARGVRLPTQRALAEQLGLGLGTVTRAYSEAEAQGLIEATVGRGSFVAGRSQAAAPGGVIEMGHNIPPLAPARGALRSAMAALARRGDLAERLDYAPTRGFEADRRAGAAWLRRTANFADADAERLIITAGAQQAIAVAVASLTQSGEALVVEAATFHGVRLAAALHGVRLAPAAMDGEGMTPEALDRAIAESGAKAAYVLPVQNPTARVMSLKRREAIVAVARRRGIVLIEDDLYGPHVADLGLPPLAQLAPDIVAYISGLSKCLAPGLRVGFLIPPAHPGAALEALRAVAQGSPTFGPLVATQWIESGEAFDLWAAVRAEVLRRTELAFRLMGGRLEPLTAKASLHVWLPLAELEAERVASQAMRAGVRLTPPTAPFVGGAPVDGLRLCLGAANDLATLAHGLSVVKNAIEPEGALAENVV